MGGVATGGTVVVCAAGATDGAGVATWRIAVDGEDAGVDREAPHREHSEEPRGIPIPHALQFVVSTRPTSGTPGLIAGGLTFGGMFAAEAGTTDTMGIGGTGGSSGTLAVCAVRTGA